MANTFYKPVVLLLALGLAACSEDPQPQPEATLTASSPPAQTQGMEPLLAQRVEQLAKAVEYAEDVSAIKKLQRSYGYYLDKGLWTDLAEFFADEAVANYPAGIYKGKASITEHLYRNVGSVEMGQVGLGDERLYNHLNIQPVVHLDPSGGTAEGRWRALAMFGRYGSPGATWAEGIYNMVYIKEDGVWKIWNLEYNSGFGDSYATGWGANPGAAPRAARTYPHPADEARNMACEGYPAACVTAFHYDNLGTSEDSAVWRVPAALPVIATEDYSARVGELLQRAQLLRDEQQIENLQRIYGYYLDRALWDQVADLFTEDGTVEYAQRGIYRGPQRIREYLGTLGGPGLKDGWLNDHAQLQTVVTVAPDGQSARIRSREWSMTGVYQQGGQWEDGIYENSFVKEDGVWKFASVHYYPTYITDYYKGWGDDAQPAPGINEALPPDAPPSEVYAIYPKAHVPAFHYRNPVTGKDTSYPVVGAPSAASIASTLFEPAAYAAPPVNDLATGLAAAEALVQQVKDHHEIENLENAYGYYLDKNLWTDLANLFAENGSMELAQRGVYQGRERVREFLFKVFGPEGPVQGRLGNHLNMQPVITLNPDGQSGNVRSRLLQQLSFNANPSMGAAVYENEVVKEDGRWKFFSTHGYNTWTASYAGGWAQNPGARVPGPSAEFPPDAPPTLVFAMFPTVYAIPFHYANPVSKRP